MFVAKKSAKGVLLAISMSLALWATFSIAEKYFFDLLFYQKSPLHGYADNVSVVASYSNNFFLKNRVKDVRKLIDPQVTFIKTTKSNPYKIVIIGDSYTYGEGVLKHQRFGDVLEKKLNKIHPTEVYILAQPGDDIVDHLAKYELAQRKIKPNLVIVALVSNDLIEVMDAKYPGQEEVYQELQTKCNPPEFDKKVTWEVMDYDILTADYLLPSVSPYYSNICYLETTIGIISANTELSSLFYTFESIPYKDRICSKHSTKTNYQMKLVSAEIEDIIMKSTDNYITYGWQKQELYKVSLREDHPSKEAHEIIAEQLFQEVIKLQKAPYY